MCGRRDERGDEGSCPSFDVFAEGKLAARMGDLMLGNKDGAVNTPPVPEQQAALGGAVGQSRAGPARWRCW